MKKQSIFFALLIFATIFSGAFLRLWQLQTVPPGLQYDEAYNGLDALAANQNQDYQVFYSENNGREGLYINFAALFLNWLGADNFGLRSTSAFFGILTLIGFFLLLRELRFSKLSQFLGVFLMAFSFWHLNFSCLVYRGIMAPFLLVWIFYFFFRGVRYKQNPATVNNRRDLLFFAAAGFLTGTGLHTYISFRVVPLILVIIAAFLILVIPHFFKKYWRDIAVFVFAAFLAAWPILVYFAQNPADFSGRSSSVSIFNAPDLSFPQAFAKSLGAHLASFFIIGDFNQRHNMAGSPLIPPAWSVLFAFGFILSLKEIFRLVRLELNILFHRKIKKISKRKLALLERGRLSLSNPLFYPSLLAQSIFWVMLIPGVLSIEGIPHALRIIGTIPAVFLFCVLPVEYFRGLYVHVKDSPTLGLKQKRWKMLKVSFWGIILVAILSGFSQVYVYFNVWAKEAKTAEALEKELFDLGRTVAEIPTRENNYLLVDSATAISQDRKDCSFKTTLFAAWPKIESYQFYHSLDALANASCQNSQFVFQKADSWLLEKFQEKCPSLQTEEFSPQNGRYGFWILR